MDGNQEIAKAVQDGKDLRHDLVSSHVPVRGGHNPPRGRAPRLNGRPNFDVSSLAVDTEANTSWRARRSPRTGPSFKALLYRG